MECGGSKGSVDMAVVSGKMSTVGFGVWVEVRLLAATRGRRSPMWSCMMSIYYENIGVPGQSRVCGSIFVHGGLHVGTLHEWVQSHSGKSRT